MPENDIRPSSPVPGPHCFTSPATSVLHKGNFCLSQLASPNLPRLHLDYARDIYYFLEDVEHNLRIPQDNPLDFKTLPSARKCFSKQKPSSPNLDDAVDGNFEIQEQHQYRGYYYLGGAHHYPYPCGTTLGCGSPAAYALSRPTPAGYSSLPSCILTPLSATEDGIWRKHGCTISAPPTRLTYCHCIWSNGRLSTWYPRGMKI